MMLMAIALSGCADRPQLWDKYASKTETLKFLTFVPCDAEIDALPQHQTYMHAWMFNAHAPAERAARWAAYEAEIKTESGVVYPIYVSYIGLQHYTAIPTGKPPADARNPQCVAVAVLPFTDAVGPFYVPVQPALLTSLAWNNVRRSLMMVLGAALILTVPFGFALVGFVEGEEDKVLSFLAVSAALILADGISWWALEWSNWEQAKETAEYYSFVDQFPRRYPAWYLPLTWSEAHTLFEGPPYPPLDLPGDATLFYRMLAASIAIWLFGYSRRVFAGFYLDLLIPNPFEAVRLRARAEGRIPTPEEYLDALAQTALGMTPWELELLTQKMKKEMSHG
jgi:hypothetical protein